MLAWLKQARRGTPSRRQRQRQPCHKPIPQICSIHSTDGRKWTGNQAIEIPYIVQENILWLT